MDHFFSIDIVLKFGFSCQIVTNGSSYRGLWDFAQLFGADVLDLDSMYSNDIYSGLITYGVEMARAVILKEVQGVFSAYNIDVDMRHLELIADYMVNFYCASKIQNLMPIFIADI